MLFAKQLVRLQVPKRPAILTPLLEQNLHLEVELSVSNQTDNLLRHDADIVVRFICPQQDSVIAVKVGQTELGLFAHEDYLLRNGIPSNPELEASGVLTGNDREPLQLAEFVRGQHLKRRCDSDSGPILF